MTTRPLTRRTVLSVLASSVLAVRWASAAEAVDLEVVLLFGTKQAKDAYPDDFPELKADPWSAFNNYTVIKQKTVHLAKDAPLTEPLTEGWTLESTLLHASPPKVQLVVREGAVQFLSGKYALTKGTRILPVTYPYKTGRAVVALRLV